jgi:hypothetical protein
MSVYGRAPSRTDLASHLIGRPGRSSSVALSVKPLGICFGPTNGAPTPLDQEDRRPPADATSLCAIGAGHGTTSKTESALNRDPRNRSAEPGRTTSSEVRRAVLTAGGRPLTPGGLSATCRPPRFRQPAIAGRRSLHRVGGLFRAVHGRSTPHGEASRRRYTSITPNRTFELSPAPFPVSSPNTHRCGWAAARALPAEVPRRSEPFGFLSQTGRGRPSPFPRDRPRWPPPRREARRRPIHRRRYRSSPANDQVQVWRLRSPGSPSQPGPLPPDVRHLGAARRGARLESHPQPPPPLAASFRGGQVVDAA